MPYTIRLPDGKLVENIPDEITPQEAKQRIIKAFPQYAPPESAFRQVADIPLQIGRGAVSGVRMIADAFGADNPASEALRGAEDYIGSLLSAQAKKDQQEIARILKDAEDKGVLDQVKAGFQALTVAPIDTLSQFLGTAAPTIVTGLGGAMLKLGATGIGAMQAGTGAAMGAGLAKGNIYEVVKDELVKSGIDEKTAEDRARQAQEYGGENLDQILLSAGLGGVAALGPLERIFARAPAIPADVAAKNMFGRAVQGGIIEGTPEAAQAFQEQVAQNIALQREGFDVPTFRGAVANATLEGLAGFGIGAPIGMFSKPPTPEAAAAETPPGAEPPLALPPPSPPEGPTGPGGPPGLPQLGGPSPTLPLLPGMAPSQFIVGDQMIRPQEQPEPIVRGPEEQPPTAIEEPTPPTEPPPTAPAAEPVDEIAVLNDQLKMIEMKRMDPTLSPNDPIFEQLDAREQSIRRKLLSLSGSPEPLDKATTPAPVITPPVTPPAAVVPPVTPPVAPPAAPPVTPPVIAPPVITTGELPEGRDPKEIKAEINRVRQSLQRTQTAVKKGQLPESDIPRLETRISNLEQELEQAKSLPKQVKYRNKEGKTWSGKGDYPPWLRASISQGFDLSEFEVLPELGNRSEDEVGFEAERPPGFGSPVPPTRIPAEMEETIAETERVRKASSNLFSVLRGRVTPQDVNDISPDTSMRLLKAKEGSGRDVSDLVEDGVLDDFLPYELRTDSGMFDPYVATEYIKDLLRQNPVDNPEARLSYDARVELNSLGIKLSELEQELEPEDVNRELQTIAAEERAVAQEAEADVLKEPQRGPAVPTGPPEFALQGETLEEAKARTERAEADREAFERKRAADLEREVFRLQPTPSAPAPAVTTGDLFGAAGMADQPARKPATVAAEPTPIEAEAAKIPPIEEAIKAELKKAGYEDLNKMSEAIQEGFGVSKPVADAYAKSVQNARIQHIRAQYGEITGEQLMDALNERDRLRKRIDGIVKRLKPKAVAQTEAEPKKEEKKLTGAYLLAIRQQNAGDRFIESVMEQFGLTKDQAQTALNKLLKEKVVSLDPVDGQFKLKDGRFWDKEVMLRAAGVETEAKPEPKKEPSAGPTFAGMQAEIDRLKAEAEAMGVELNQQTFVRDAAEEKEKAAKKKAKKEKLLLKQATRNEIEYARFDDVATDPIQATPEQLKLAKELADKVNGELVFYDKDLNVGLVTVSNDMGFDDYFPIHDGIISKVDVSDYTGLSVIDKSFLKRIKNSLEILRGASGKMLKGTEEQQKGILAVAKTLGGTPVYFDPDTNVGLVRGYGDITGQPIYSMTMGDRYNTVDVEQSTVAAFAPYKAKLIEVKKRLEKEAEKKHKDNPFIKFENGIAMSDGIDPAFRAIITEWKSMLGLGNVNIYISTIGDATKNRENFTGPHRVVGSGTLSVYEAGSMRRMEDGSYYVLFSQSTSKTSMLETIAHELGHVHEREVFRNASQDLKDKLKDAHAKWVEKRKGKTAREAINMLRAKTSAQTTQLRGEARAEELRPYWSSFSEWYADQVSRWAVTDEKPVGVVEKFFARLAAALRRFYQTLKGQGYLPDETFVEYLNQVTPKIVETIPGPIKEPVQLEMSFQMQKDLFGSTEEAKDIERVMEVKGKKLPPGRSPELAAAAQAVQAGTMSAEEYNKLVDIYKPIPLYAEPLRPATSEQVFDALDVKKREQINPQIPNGTKVGLRLDIPAFNRKGIFVVSIHQKRTGSAPGKVIGYGSVAKAKNVTFGVGNQLKALEIAAGAAKDALQTIEGEYVNISPEQAYAEAQRAIKDPSYVQVGIDPTRHAYFYDRRTTLPIVGAEEVVQIGNMILAKNPVFGKKADFLYNIDGGPINNPLEAGAKRDNEVKETIQDLRNIRREKMVLPSKVRDYGSAAESQRILSSLNVLEQEMNDDLNSQKYDGYTAENFMRQARKSYDDGSISAEVFAVIQAVYMENPRLLDGLRLDIKQKFSPEEIAQRTAEGKKSPIGAFQPFERLVNLYTGTKGVVDPETIRHELTHTLEQLMTPAQRKAVVNSYIAALKKAARKHKDARSQEFFDKVIKFLDFPTKENHEAMNNALPSIDFYQYTNPSEYWAVNAEKLMAQRLGNSWDRFKKSVRKMFEKMKDIFGFDNRYAVYDVFDKVMSGSRERMDNRMLTAFIQSSNQNYDFLQNIADDADLIKKYNRSDTPMLDTAPMKRLMIDAVQFSKDAFTEMVNSPTEALRMTFNSLNRGVMYLRNKNIWFGSGLNEADRIKYNGQVRTANGLATASLALDNMLRGGNIATQALFLGGIEYNPNTLTFTAVRKEKNMTKVYEAEAAIKKRIGEQLGTNIIQGYLEAKRSRSIKDEVIARTPKVEKLKQDYETRAAALKKMEADPKAKASDVSRLRREIKQISRELKDAQEDLDNIKAIAKDKVTMSDAEIADFISREKAHPELKEIMDNFNAVNQNMLKFWRQVGLLSQSRYETLAGIKDYVPWYRIMNDEEDVHSPLQATTRSATNIGREKIFKSGKPSVINDFIIEENQDLFKIQPGRINMVKLNGKRLTDKDFTVTPQGEVRLTVPYKPGDVLVIQTQREIENMIDNMTRNVMRMTMNGLRQYAAQRIVSEYATRGADGKIMTFPTVDRERGRFDFISEGRRVVVEIQDPLIAEAALGMETVGMQMWKPLAAAANFTRRTITLSPVFQLKQVFKDAPTAALVTGVKNPAALIGGVYKGFIDAVRDSDPAASILRSAGIGGFYSPARTPEADVKRRIGIINNNTFDYVMKGLDHWGDSSDMAQRIATYNRVMAETGDEALAMYQAANVINFLRHGSGQLSQALVKTVPFLNAYAQSIDVLYNALVGGGLRGLDRKKALQRLAFTGSLLAGTTLLYAMLVGDDDDYLKMDDQSKVRSYMIPGTDVVLPMNTSAAFFFKAIPELIYNKVVNEGTENEMDERRLRRAMKESAIDMLLGPTPIPSAVKPFIEISLDYNFFTSRSITPRGMENLDAYQQYDMRTSEAAKLLSGLTGTTENRLLNPMDADHLIRSLFGTAGAMAAWSSNLIGQGSEYRPEMGLKDMPITGAFLRQEVPRGREDLFYTLKESTDRKYRTLNRLIERDNMAEADAYLEKYPNLIAYYDYTSEVDTSLKEINAAIRYIGETQDPSYTPDRKREEIRELLEMKNDILEGVEMFRKEAYAD